MKLCIIKMGKTIFLDLKGDGEMHTILTLSKTVGLNTNLEESMFTMIQMAINGLSERYIKMENM